MYGRVYQIHYIDPMNLHIQFINNRIGRNSFETIYTFNGMLVDVDGRKIVSIASA